MHNFNHVYLEVQNVIFQIKTSFKAFGVVYKEICVFLIREFNATGISRGFCFPLFGLG